MHVNGTCSPARPHPRPRRREFVTTIGTEDLGRYAGVGLTLEQVIKEELRNVRGVAPAAVEESDDLVIWEGNKIAALIRTGADGRPVVTRCDGPAARCGESVSAEGELGATDVLAPASGPGRTAWVQAAGDTRAAIRQLETLRRIADEAHQHSLESCHAEAAPVPEGTAWEFWQRFGDVAREGLALSEKQLCRAIDNLAAAFETHNEPRGAASGASPRGVVEGGRLYLVHDPAASAALVVVDLKNVVRLEPGRTGVPTDSA
jgi:hypothetical protein